MKKNMLCTAEKSFNLVEKHLITSLFEDDIAKMKTADSNGQCFKRYDSYLQTNVRLDS